MNSSWPDQIILGGPPREMQNEVLLEFPPDQRSKLSFAFLPGLYESAPSESSESWKRKCKASSDLPRQPGPPQPAGAARATGFPRNAAHSPSQPSLSAQPLGSTSAIGSTLPSAATLSIPSAIPTYTTGFGASYDANSSISTAPPASALEKPNQTMEQPRTFQELMNGGYCLHYHLRGKCIIHDDGGECLFIHGQRLEPADIERMAAEGRQF